MRRKNEELFTVIREFINSYYLENGKGPSTRDIEAGTGIQRITVERMAELGVDPAGIRAAVGAAIRGCCYEVGDDFVEAVAASPYGGICLDFIGQKDGRPHADLLGMNVGRFRLPMLEMEPQNEEKLKWENVHVGKF